MKKKRKNGTSPAVRAKTKGNAKHSLTIRFSREGAFVSISSPDNLVIIAIVCILVIGVWGVAALLYGI